MRSVQVVASIHNEASGPSYSVVRLCGAMRQHGAGVTLAVLDFGPTPREPEYVRRFAVTGLPRRLGRSRTMQRWLTEAGQQTQVDVVHNHGLWTMPNVYAGRAARQTAKPLVVSPRGTLSEWALSRSRWRKKLMWHLAQHKAVKDAAGFHATARSECEEIRRMGFTQPVHVIPNGIDVPEGNKSEGRIDGPRTVLFLGRVHPTKGVESLLEAWRILHKRFPEWELNIVGPDNDGHLHEMKDVAVRLGLARVDFKGPVYGNEKVRAYREAEIFVLPTWSENFGIAIAESLAAGTPVVVTKGAPWAGLEERNAGWWIDIGIEPLVETLEKAMVLSPSELREMGSRGREWMRTDFSWERIGSMMIQSYEWIVNGGSAPPWVHV